MPIDSTRSRHGAGKNLGRHTQTGKRNLTGTVRTVRGEQPLLQADKTDGRHGAHGTAHDDTAIGMQTGWQIEGQTGRAMGVDRRDRIGISAAHRPLQARAQ